MRDSSHSPTRSDVFPPAGVSPIDEAAWQWVRRIQAGLTVEEEIAFSEWLEQDPRHGSSFEKYRAAWDRFAPLAEGATVSADSMHRSPAGAFHPETASHPTRAQRAFPAGRSSPYRWLAPVLGAAAAVALLALALLRDAGPAAAPMTAAVILPGLCEQRTLADGSVVELNRGAEITVHFTGEQRRIHLERGEASFAVAKEAARPFVVVAGQVEVRAIGTSFNVRFEPSAVEVVVTEGRVQVEDRPSRKNPAAAPSGAVTEKTAEAGGAVLTAGQKALVRFAEAPGPLEVASLTPEEIEARLAWQPRLLDFDDVPLAEIIAEFNRRNPVRLVAPDAVVANRRVTATFRSDNLEAFVRLIETHIGVKVQRLSDTEIALLPK